MNTGSTPEAAQELREFVALEYEKDDAVAAAEYGAEFRKDLADFVSLEIIKACTVEGRDFQLRVMAQSHYAFCDPSGGEQDSFTLAIGHKSPEGIVVIDWITEVRAPFNPKHAVKEAADALSSYGCGSVHGDHYGGQLIKSMFLEEGITYLLADKPKSDYYVELMPLLNSRQIELPDCGWGGRSRRVFGQLVPPAHFSLAEGRRGRSRRNRPPQGPQERRSRPAPMFGRIMNTVLAEPGAGSALASAVPAIAGAVGFEMSTLVIDRLTKL